MGHQFDDLAKSFASGMSRREALKRTLLGAGAAVGATLLPWRKADAATLQYQCQRYCYQRYGKKGKTPNHFLFDVCEAEASMQQGACYTDPSAPGYRFSCSNPQSRVVCASNEVCCNGKCCRKDLCGQIFLNGNHMSGTNMSGAYLISQSMVNGSRLCIGCASYNQAGTGGF